MATIRYNTVLGGPTRKNDPQAYEGLMVAALPPGSVVGVNSTGGIVVAPTTGSPAIPLILRENMVGGGDITAAVPLGATGVALLTQDDVTYHVLVAASSVLTKFTPLAHNGAGALKVAIAGDVVLFHAWEAYTVASDGPELVAVRRASSSLFTKPTA